MQAKPHDNLRSPHWPRVRAEHLKVEPACQVCGSKKLLEVHHVKPFHLHPELELVQTNLVTLCEGKAVNCHFLFGHFMDWKDANPNVREDAGVWRPRLA